MKRLKLDRFAKNMLLAVFSLSVNICYSQDISPNELQGKSNDIELLDNMDLFISSLNYYKIDNDNLVEWLNYF